MAQFHQIICTLACGTQSAITCITSQTYVDNSHLPCTSINITNPSILLSGEEHTGNSRRRSICTAYHLAERSQLSVETNEEHLSMTQQSGPVSVTLNSHELFQPKCLGIDQNPNSFCKRLFDNSSGGKTTPGKKTNRK